MDKIDLDEIMSVCDVANQETHFTIPLDVSAARREVWFKALRWLPAMVAELREERERNSALLDEMACINGLLDRLHGEMYDFHQISAPEAVEILVKEHLIWAKHRLVQIVIDRNELRERMRAAEQDALWFLPRGEVYQCRVCKAEAQDNATMTHIYTCPFAILKASGEDDD